MVVAKTQQQDWLMVAERNRIRTLEWCLPTAAGNSAAALAYGDLSTAPSYHSECSEL
jgi:hypothetical protein